MYGCSWNNHLILNIAREGKKRKSASIFSPKSYLNNQLRSCFFFCCTFMMNGRHKMHSNATIAQKAKPLFALESQVIKTNKNFFADIRHPLLVLSGSLFN